MKIRRSSPTCVEEFPASSSGIQPSSHQQHHHESNSMAPQRHSMSQLEMLIISSQADEANALIPSRDSNDCCHLSNEGVSKSSSCCGDATTAVQDNFKTQFNEKEIITTTLLPSSTTSASINFMSTSKTRNRTKRSTSLSTNETFSTNLSLETARSIRQDLSRNSSNNRSKSSWQLYSWCVRQIENPSQQIGRAFALFSSAIYGTNFATVKVLNGSIPLSIGASMRFTVAAGAVAAVTFYQEMKKNVTSSGSQDEDDDCENENENESRTLLQRQRTAALWSGVEIGVWDCIGYICQAEGLETMEAGKSAFFSALAVVLVPLLDVAIRGKLLRVQDMISVALALLGVAILEVGPGGDMSLDEADVLALAQTVFFGIGYWRLESESQKHSSQDARLTVGQMSAIALGSIIYTAINYTMGAGAIKNGGLGFPPLEQFATWCLDPFVVGAVLWTGLMATALAMYLETVALKVISASELTLLMTTVSIWGAGFAYVTIGEVLTTTGFVGGAFILAGCILSSVPLSSCSCSSKAPYSLLAQEETLKINLSTASSTASSIELSTSRLHGSDVDVESG